MKKVSCFWRRMIATQFVRTLEKRIYRRTRSADSPFSTAICSAFPRAQQARAKVRLPPLLLEVQRDERPADPMRDRGFADGIKQRCPKQIAWNRQRMAEQYQGSRVGELPENDHEGCEGRDGAEQVDPQGEGAGHQQLDVRRSGVRAAR